MTNKCITLAAGDWIKLSDIPNEQVFNLVEKCFSNAGFTNSSKWYNRGCWDAFYLSDEFYEAYSCFVAASSSGCKRRLSLSDVFNSVNGGFDWHNCEYMHLFNDGSVIYNHVEKLHVNYPTYAVKRIPEHVEATTPPKTPPMVGL